MTLDVRIPIARSAAILIGSLTMATAAAAPVPSASEALAVMPLASYAQGQSIVQQAVSSLQPDINFTFLNKTYENDVYVREPITGNKVRV
ncbi:MAG: hypothetical protein ACT4O5_11730, partial [Gammaproteobacteria bacterium]